jgi:hypothetical protein
MPLSRREGRAIGRSILLASIVIGCSIVLWARSQRYRTLPLDASNSMTYGIRIDRLTGRCWLTNVGEWEAMPEGPAAPTPEPASSEQIAALRLVYTRFSDTKGDILDAAAREAGFRSFPDFLTSDPTRMDATSVWSLIENDTEIAAVLDRQQGR